MAINYNADLEHLSGLERLRHLKEHAGERFGMAKLLDYTIAEIDDGRVCLRYTPRDEHMNLIGSIHGGILASLLDTAMGCALLTTLGAGERHTIIDLHTKFVRAVSAKGGPLTVVGMVEHRGRRQCTIRGEIISADDKLCATGTSTAMLI